MTLLEQFRAADKKVTELENNDGLFLCGYGAAESTEAYDKALAESQSLYNQLIEKGIDPFQS